MAWLVGGVVLLAVLTAALLGHLDWAGRLAVRVWRRFRPEPPKTATVSVEQLAADLHRLADGLERAYRQDQPAKRPDDGADDYGGNDARDGHGPSRLPQGRSIDPRTGVPGRTHYVDTKM